MSERVGIGIELMSSRINARGVSLSSSWSCMNIAIPIAAGEWEMRFCVGVWKSWSSLMTSWMNSVDVNNQY